MKMLRNLKSRLRIAAATAAILLGLAPASAQIGDADRGAEVYNKQCKSCHMLGEDARNRVGPHLNGLFGRKAASIEGYRYSKDMQRAGADGLVWQAEQLDVYVTKPQALVTGTRMSFRGIKDSEKRADLIAFLRAYSDSPQDIPEAAPTADPTEHDVDPAILAIVGDPEYGEYLSGECTTCHQASGADQGIPSITGWPQEDFVFVMQAYKSKARPHPVMRMIAGRLSDEEIAGLAAYFEGVE